MKKTIILYTSVLFYVHLIVAIKDLYIEQRSELKTLDAKKNKTKRTFY